ncbi:hypothetical protein E2C01_057298 [Portunus trituberculatus]|uniref:Uncharacterized protein n=1 Tax=Portunus trituberculatus TaxID=210409 RepID=A0A5B7H2Z7_PORTR|nr:hypothetical protein [Portunus trituberculatus]
MTNRETITKLIKENNRYETPEEMSELMNESFKSVFNEEGDFIEPNNQATQKELRNIVVHKQRISKLLEGVDVRKAMGPDGVSGWTLRECRDQSGM